MKLKKIDLKRAVKTDEGGYTHPDINLEKWYLAKIGGSFYAGQFDTDWYGLYFDGWKGDTLQFDPPGVNGSDWQELYEIVQK